MAIPDLPKLPVDVKPPFHAKGGCNGQYRIEDDNCRRWINGLSKQSAEFLVDLLNNAYRKPAWNYNRNA